MKKILLLTLILFSANLLASGKLSIQPQYFTDTQKVTPQFGLSVYEKILYSKKLAYNGWFGYGEPSEEDKDLGSWYVIKNSFDYYASEKIVLSPGVQSSFSTGEEKPRHRVFVKLTYQLW